MPQSHQSALSMMENKTNMKTNGTYVPHYTCHFLQPSQSGLEYFVILLIPKVIDSATDRNTVKSYWDQTFLFFISPLGRPKVKIFGHLPYWPGNMNNKVLGRSYSHESWDTTNTEEHQDIKNMQIFQFSSKNISSSLKIHFFIVQFPSWDWLI